VKVALDAMGGDHAPEEIVKGAIEALSFPYIEKIFLVGDEEKLRKIDGIDNEKFEIVHASQVIEMDDHPAQAYRRKKDASITVATKMVKDGLADAVVSAGSTGAQMVAGIFTLGRIKGISRPAIGTIVPTGSGPRFITDVGANTKVDVENLVQFAQMGSIYMERVRKVENPKVGLINNGAEETKGSELTQNAYQALKGLDNINFIGNIEGRDIPQGVADVMVCDGFTGNVVLKTMEGLAKTIMQMLKAELMSSARGKIGAVLLKPSLSNLKKMMDYAQYGGAPLLGVDGVSIVCHGSSNAEAIKNGIRVAYECVENCFVDEIKSAMKKIENTNEGGADNE